MKTKYFSLTVIIVMALFSFSFLYSEYQVLLNDGIIRKQSKDDSIEKEFTARMMLFRRNFKFFQNTVVIEENFKVEYIKNELNKFVSEILDIIYFCGKNNRPELIEESKKILTELRSLRKNILDASLIYEIEKKHGDCMASYYYEDKKDFILAYFSYMEYLKKHHDIISKLELDIRSVINTKTNEIISAFMKKNKIKISSFI